jgi:adenosylhomocysteine nucleosidase
MPRTAIIAALPREIAPLVRGLTADSTLRRRHIYLYRLEYAVVVAAGMGAIRATLAVEAALAQPGITTLLSTGLAGACTHLAHPGEIIEAGIVIDAQTGERYAASSASTAVLVTTDAIANIREKSRLARSYLATLVDMEAATVARLAAAHGLAFRALKAVSDAHDFELESLARFANPHGHFRTAAFALHTAVRPKHWPRTIQLGRHSKQALAALNARLKEIAATNSSS